MVEKRVETLIPLSFSRRRIIMPPPPWPLKFLTLKICFASRPPMRYAIRSLPADPLFNYMDYAFRRSRTKPPEIHLPEIRELFTCSPCTGVGSAVLRSNVYIVGGLHPDFFIKNPEAVHDPYVDAKKAGKTVFAYNITRRLLPPTIVPDMISPKTDPLVLAVVGEEEKLYVLSDNMHPNIRPPVFESYTLSTNSWEQLDPPPFLNPMSKYFDTCRHHPYASAVIGTSICVSTDKTSFKFDIEKKIWEPCMLFEDFRTPVVDNDRRSWYVSNDADDTPCGPPFGFIGKAVLFEDDVLICRVPYSKGSVVAYKIEGGKVVYSQSLMAQGLEIPPDAESSCFADFGNGLFCLVLTIDKVLDEPPILIVKPFFIKKKTVMKPEDFLHCEIIQEFKYVGLDTEGWYSLCCFAQ